jgi:hypothetical protein
MSLSCTNLEEFHDGTQRAKMFVDPFCICTMLHAIIHFSDGVGRRLFPTHRCSYFTHKKTWTTLVSGSGLQISGFTTLAWPLNLPQPPPFTWIPWRKPNPPTPFGSSSLIWHHQQPHRQVIWIQAPLFHLLHCHLHEENGLMMKSCICSIQNIINFNKKSYNSTDLAST